MANEYICINWNDVRNWVPQRLSGKLSRLKNLDGFFKMWSWRLSKVNILFHSDCNEAIGMLLMVVVWEADLGLNHAQ